MNDIYYFLIDSPIGEWFITHNQNQCMGIVSSVSSEVTIKKLSKIYPTCKITEKQNREIAIAVTNYFSGNCEALKMIRFLRQGTPFQQSVWNVIESIEPGETQSYQYIAEKIGRPYAYRAVGTACGANSLLLVIPCHRVVGKGKNSMHYAGGSSRKAWLLNHEYSFKKTVENR